MKVARWRTIITLMGLLAGIGGCGEDAPGSSESQPSDVTDTTQGTDSGDAPVTPPDDTATPPDDTATPPDDTVPLPCLLAEPPALQFGNKLCEWTWTETLTLKACGKTPVTLLEVGLAMDENGDCIGHNCAFYAVEAAAPMTLDTVVASVVLVHYSPPNESVLGSNGQLLFDSATVLVHFDGGQLAVPVSGLGVSTPCAAPHMTMYSQGTAIADGHTVAVGTTLSFVATPTCGDGPASDWKWTVKPPEGATATWALPTTIDKPTLTPNNPGKYTVNASFWDKNGDKSCAPGTVTFWVDEGS